MRKTDFAANANDLQYCPALDRSRPAGAFLQFKEVANLKTEIEALREEVGEVKDELKVLESTRKDVIILKDAVYKLARAMKLLPDFAMLHSPTRDSISKPKSEYNNLVDDVIRKLSP